MVELYIQYTDGNFYLLDLEDSEAINLKITAKDLTDITKIWSPYTQAFNIKASDKNKILCGFVGNEKIQRSNNKGEFNSKIYISGFIFQSGILSFDESSYEFQDQKSFKTNFANNLTSLTEKLGDSTIQSLFQNEAGSFDDILKIDWNVFTLKDRLTSVKNYTLSNGIEFKYGIPFISNNRVWTYDDDNLDVVDNIAFKKTRTELTVNQISLSEIRPAINYMSIMKHLLLKIGTPITCPLFEKPELKDAFVWCNSESLIVPDAASYPLINYGGITVLRFDTKDQISGVPIPGFPRWDITGGAASGIFKVKRNNAADRPNSWSDGFNISLKFNGLATLEGIGTKIKVNIRNATSNVILDSQEIEGDTYTWRLLDPIGKPSQLDSNGELLFKLEILPTTLLKWTNIQFQTLQEFRESKGGIGGNRVTRAKFSHTAFNGTDSGSLGGNKLNLITTLPKMKCVDFLKSFFKTFNISVISTGLQDQSMYWLTPSDVNEINKPYSKRIVDYTAYVDTASTPKKRGNAYNQYVFSHLPASKYYDAIFGDGSLFGGLIYPEETPAKVNKFEVITAYSILKQSATFNHPSSARTCLGFSKESPTIADNGGIRYKPVYEEFTIFYLQAKSLNINTVSVEYTKTQNNQLAGVLEASFAHPVTGKTLGFGAVDTYTDSLYINYYMSLINLLLAPNTYKSEFTLTLPPNEIFLNFANLKQGESNIPTGFRPQNEIVIGEQRYSLVDAAIDLTTGKTKLTSLNF